MGVRKRRKVRKIPVKSGGFILPALAGLTTAATVIKTIKDSIEGKKFLMKHKDITVRWKIWQKEKVST